MRRLSSTFVSTECPQLFLTFALRSTCRQQTSNGGAIFGNSAAGNSDHGSSLTSSSSDIQRPLRSRASPVLRHGSLYQRSSSSNQIPVRVESLLNEVRRAVYRSGQPSIELQELLPLLHRDVRGELERSEYGSPARLLALFPEWFTVLSSLPDEDTRTPSPSDLLFVKASAKERLHVSLSAAAIQLGDSPNGSLTPDGDNNGDVGFQRGAAGRSDASHREITAPSRFVRVLNRAGAVIGSVDVNQPPVLDEDIDAMRLSFACWSQSTQFRPDVATPAQLLPAGYEWQPIPELGSADALYAKKGLVTPSEVVEGMLQFLPSFFVEMRFFVKSLPPDVHAAWFKDQPRYPDGRIMNVNAPFELYPMIFELQVNRFRRTLIRASSEFAFVRLHPHYRRADRNLRRYSQEFKAASGVLSKDAVYLSRQRQQELHSSSMQAEEQQEHTNERVEIAKEEDDDGLGLSDDAKTFPTTTAASSSANGDRDGSGAVHKAPIRVPRASIDVQIFQMLVRHLPVENPYTFWPLAQWVNTFSEEELALLNEVPQQRVVTILQRYCRVFQLSTVAPQRDDFSLFQTLTLRKSTAPSPSSSTVVDTSTEQQGTPTSHGTDSTQSIDARSPDERGSMNSPPPQKGLTEELQEMRDTDDCGTEEPHLDEKDDTSLAPSSRIRAVDEEGNSEIVAQRVKKFQSQLSDDLIDLDRFVEGDAQETFDRGEVEDDEGSGAPMDAAEDDAKDGVSLAESESGNDEALRPHGGSGRGFDRVSREEEEVPSEITFGIDALVVRRLPRDIAPRSLRDFDASNTPDAELLQHVMSFLHPPPSSTSSDAAVSSLTAVSSPGTTRTVSLSRFGRPKHSAVAGGLAAFPISPKDGSAAVWRWVSIHHIYLSIPSDQRYRLRPYRGLANFARMHGRLFEVSEDLSYVISHCPNGTVPPLIPTQKTFSYEERVVLPHSTTGEDNKTRRSGAGGAGGGAMLVGDEERARYHRILGDSQIPTTRTQLILLDPQNPMLNVQVLLAEFAEFLPDHPVTLQRALLRMPPVMKAAMPHHFKRAVLHSPMFRVTKDERGMVMIQRRIASTSSSCDRPADAPYASLTQTTIGRVIDGAVPATTPQGPMSLTRAVQHVAAMVPPEGERRAVLLRKISSEARAALVRELGKDEDAVFAAFPDVFEMVQEPSSQGVTKMVYLKRDRESSGDLSSKLFHVATSSAE